MANDRADLRSSSLLEFSLSELRKAVSHLSQFGVAIVHKPPRFENREQDRQDRHGAVGSKRGTEGQVSRKSATLKAYGRAGRLSFRVAKVAKVQRFRKAQP